jgi:hypothetical protein
MVRAASSVGGAGFYLAAGMLMRLPLGFIDVRRYSEYIDACQYSRMTGSGGVQALRSKALADPGRLRLLSIVKAEPAGESRVCDPTGPLDLGQPAGPGADLSEDFHHRLDVAAEELGL